MQTGFRLQQSNKKFRLANGRVIAACQVLEGGKDDAARLNSHICALRAVGLRGSVNNSGRVIG